MESSVFWDIALYGPLKVNRRFGGTYRFHIQDRRITREIDKRESYAYHQLSRWFLAQLFFYHNDGEKKFLRNVG
jgi:hypothetical protein